MKKVSTCLSLYDNILSQFRVKYNVNLSSFVERAMVACINDEKLFNEIFVGIKNVVKE